MISNHSIIVKMSDSQDETGVVMSISWHFCSTYMVIITAYPRIRPVTVLFGLSPSTPAQSLALLSQSPPPKVPHQPHS